MIKNFFRILFIPSVGLSAVGLALLFTAISLMYVWFTRPPRVPSGSPTAALSFIPGATSTPPPPTLTPTLLVSPTQAGPPTPLPGEIGVGSLVQISGTGGDALNIRLEPGLSSEVFFLGFDAEVFEVGDGPRMADGFTWWYLVTPVDEDRSGWAASLYLLLVEIP
ncbi:MAG: hypothetical protein FVQ83_15640 [Chloroflexi bacterium]|nr:hypothetical protein [Chloroflexota bacterium]